MIAFGALAACWGLLRSLACLNLRHIGTIVHQPATLLYQGIPGTLCAIT